MTQTLLTCPLCKRVNEAGTRFCRGCGRLLVEPDLEVSATEHAPLYEGHASLLPDEPEPERAADAPDITAARLIIRTLPGSANGGADPGAQAVSEFALEGRSIVIGRTQDCDVVFEGDTLTSRRHAILRCEANHYTVADLGSSNGTFVNDLEINAPAPLKHGDRILIGDHELLFLLDQPRAITTQDAALEAATGSAAAEPEPAPAPGDQSKDTPPSTARPTAAPASATAKYASVARLSTELAASASRMVAPRLDDAELNAIRARLLEASEALTQQAGLQTALAERRRAALVELRERVSDLAADLRGDETHENSPVHHKQDIGLLELVESVANDPENPDRVRMLAGRADELAQALRGLGPSEETWKYERARTLRGLDDILYRLRELV